MGAAMLVAFLAVSLLTMLVASAGFALVPQPASACSCAQMSAEETAGRASGVFRGRVREITEQSRSDSENGNWRITFDIEHVWKGRVETMTWALGGAEKTIPGTDYTVENTCNVTFTEGTSYVVVIESDAGRWTSWCGGTHVWGGTSSLLSALGPGVGIEVDAATHALSEQYTSRFAALPYVGDIIVVLARALDTAHAIVIRP